MGQHPWATRQCTRWLLLPLLLAACCTRPAHARSEPAVPGAVDRLQIPKVALLFITRGEMPHERTWAAWLAAAKWLVPGQSANRLHCESVYRPPRRASGSTAAATGQQHLREQALFSLYVHAAPGFAGYAADSVFAGRVIDTRVEVAWGGHSMVVAMRLLLRAALAQRLNQRFAFVCEQTVPLYPPAVVWQQLVSEPRSRLRACRPGPREMHGSFMRRWTPAMLPHLPRECWVKSSQWLALTRPHAQLADADTLLLSIFERHCRPERLCVGDEHYFPVVLAHAGLANETNCADNLIATLWQDGYDHPVSFSSAHAVPRLLLRLRQDQYDWRAAPQCRDGAALAAAARAFVRADADWNFACSALAGLQPYDAALLSHHSCTLLARKFDPESADKVLELVTSCDESLGIAPSAECGSKGRGSMRLAKAGAVLGAERLHPH